MSRQRDGVAAGFAGSRGGRLRGVPGKAFGEEEGDQLGVDPSSGEARRFGGQGVEVGDTFHALEGELDLPAKAVEVEDVVRGEGCDGQGGEEENKVGGFKAARVRFAATLLGFLEQPTLFGLCLMRLLASDHQAHDQRVLGRVLRGAFMNADLHVGLLRHLRQGGEEIERTAVRAQQTQRVPAAAHDEVGPSGNHRTQIARAGIVAVGQHDIAGPIAEALQLLGAAPVGQLQLIHLARGQIVANVQPPTGPIGTRLTNRGRIQRPQAMPSPASGRHRRLLRYQRPHEVREPRPRLLKALEQSRIRQARNPGCLCPGAGLAQRHPAPPIGQCQPQQRLRGLHFPPPLERSSRPRRPIKVKIRRQLLAHRRPPIQDLTMCFHPDLESHRDSSRLLLILAPMTPTLSPRWAGR